MARFYQVVNALIQAGKVFDLLVVPNGGHGAGADYAIRKRNDCFVQWLLGVTPPDWNAGAGLKVERASSLGSPSDDDPAPSFYDGPDDPPYVWWQAGAPVGSPGGLLARRKLFPARGRGRTLAR